VSPIPRQAAKNAKVILSLRIYPTATFAALRDIFPLAKTPRTRGNADGLWLIADWRIVLSGRAFLSGKEIKIKNFASKMLESSVERREEQCSNSA
jgi:hypothetical protein